MALKLVFSAFKPKLINSNKTINKYPIIVTHSLFGHRGNWDDFAPKLANETQSLVYTLDARNHGDSPRYPTGNFIDMSNDVLRFFKDHDIKQCHLFGHSMGGLTSMALTLTQKSSLVKSMAVIDVSPIAAPEPMIALNSKIVNTMRNVINSLKPNTNLEEARKICYEELELLKIHPSTSKVLISNIRKEGDTFKCTTNLDVIEKRFVEDMFSFPKLKSSSNLPVIFLRGEKPIYLRVEHEPEILKLFPNASFKYIDGATHQVHIDCPDALMNHYLNFFKRVASTQNS